MLVGNEYLPCLRLVTPQSMYVTKLDLLDLSLIGPNAPGIWAIWSLMLTKKMDLFNLPSPKFFLGKELSCLRHVVAAPPQDPIWPMNFIKSTL
jgi:hypothetical protein